MEEKTNKYEKKSKILHFKLGGSFFSFNLICIEEFLFFFSLSLSTLQIILLFHFFFVRQ
jgi:hypothetical protein